MEDLDLTTPILAIKPKHSVTTIFHSCAYIYHFIFFTLVLLLCFCEYAEKDGNLSENPVAFFDSVFSDFMVLQQAPSTAQFYGTFKNTVDNQPKIELKLISLENAYSIRAYILNKTWRAQFLPVTASVNWQIFLEIEGKVVASIKNVSFGDVWYCGGQSNMALPLNYTFSRNLSIANILQGRYSNIRLFQLAGNMNPRIPWKTVSAAVRDKSFLSFSSTCYYFAESLVDETRNDSGTIGLIHTAFGGSSIQEWLPSSSLARCRYVNNHKGHASIYYRSRVLPFTHLALKGWIWYQGEINMLDFYGNSMMKSGYSCLITELVRVWRESWSQGTSEAHADKPFGVVTIPNSGSIGAPDPGFMRIAQTGSYGILPNQAMENTFLVQAYDLNDPFSNMTCHSKGCCEKAESSINCEGCSKFCASIANTSFFLGPIHPRVKKEIGLRLTRSYLGLSRLSQFPLSGPTLLGCRIHGNFLEVMFNETILKQDTVSVHKYNTGLNASQFQILLADTLCMQREGKGTTHCWDNGTGIPNDEEWAIKTKDWVSVNIESSSPYSIRADLSDVPGIPYAVRYGWGDCCHPRKPTSEPCKLKACPIMSSKFNIPANPFIARIVDSKCECFLPQKCDG